MSCLDVMYQVYGPAPPQPYFTSAYSPYHHHHHHHQKLAFYSKMQEAHESTSSSSSFSSSLPLQPPCIKEEQDCSGGRGPAAAADGLHSSSSSSKDPHHHQHHQQQQHHGAPEPPPEAEYLSSRCVLFTYFHGDISAVVDEHFSRALSQQQQSGGQQASSGTAAGSKSTRDGSFPMNQRSFPPSFWNSAYQPSVPTSLGNALSSPHTELPFPGDPYSSAASLHNHLHQPSPEAWHPSHHHHHHHHHPYSLGGAIGGQGSAYSRPGVHEVYGAAFDPRYGSLLVPSVRPHHRLGPGSSVPGPSGSPCDIVGGGGGKGGESAAGSAWSGAFTGASEIGLNMDADNETDDRALTERLFPKVEDRVKFMSALEQLKLGVGAPVMETEPTEEEEVPPLLSCKVKLPPAVLTALTNKDTDLLSHAKNRLKNMLIQALYDHLSKETLYPSHTQYVDLLKSVLYNFPYLKESYGTGFEALHESLKNKFKKERKPLSNVDEIDAMRKKYSVPNTGRRRMTDLRSVLTRKFKV